MSLPEALYTVSQAAHGVPMTTEWWLRARIVVDAAFPVTGYVTVDTDDGEPDDRRVWMRTEADYQTVRLGY